MKSFWKSRSCLFAVALAAGGAGTFLELQAASGQQGRHSTGALIVIEPGFGGASAFLTENGDGTAFTLIGVPLSPTLFLGPVIFDNTDYAISTDVTPGHTTRGPGSGEGEFTMTGVFAFDFSTFMLVGPFDVSVELAVSGDTIISAFVQQGVFTLTAPFTGEVIGIVRRNTHGSQAMGVTAGSLSIQVTDSITGAPVLDVDSTGNFGAVSEFSVNTVEVIH